MGDNIRDSVVNMVAAVLGMIPEGLVLLTSVALTLGALKLAQKKTLVQELYCIETLARADTLCLDKTGTITEGTCVWRRWRAIRRCMMRFQRKYPGKILNPAKVTAMELRVCDFCSFSNRCDRKGGWKRESRITGKVRS